MKAPILCLYGPPGVGKTSLGRICCQSAGPQVCAHVAGWGARRGRDTGPPPYLCGRHAGQDHQPDQESRGSANPVIILDEIDKLASDFRGDPASRSAGGAGPGAEPLPSWIITWMWSTTSRRCFSLPLPTPSIPFSPPCATGWRSSRSPAIPWRRKLEIARRHLVPKQ